MLVDDEEPEFWEINPTNSSEELAREKVARSSSIGVRIIRASFVNGVVGARPLGAQRR